MNFNIVVVNCLIMILIVSLFMGVSTDLKNVQIKKEICENIGIRYIDGDYCYGDDELYKLMVVKKTKFWGEIEDIRLIKEEVVFLE